MPKLKAKLNKSGFEALADNLKEFYTQKGEDYILDADIETPAPAPTAPVVDENHPLIKGLKSQVENLNNSYKAALEQQKAITASFHKKEVETAALQAFTKKGGVATATQDLLYRVGNTFSVDDQLNVVAKQGDKIVFSKKDPSKPMSIEEYVDNLSAEAPHLFNKPQGGGSQGAGNPAAQVAPKDNPFITKNLTEQIKLTRSNPELAAQMKLQADAAAKQAATTQQQPTK